MEAQLVEAMLSTSLYSSYEILQQVGGRTVSDLEILYMSRDKIVHREDISIDN